MFGIQKSCRNRAPGERKARRNCTRDETTAVQRAAMRKLHGTK
jgi:hypothetical protein